MEKTVMVGVSGGVDSTSALFLLKDAGYSVKAATLSFLGSLSGCGSLSGAKYAAEVTQSLGFIHYVYDASDGFKQNVTDKFAEAYIHGTTPNPCVICNRTMKFPLLLRCAEENGCDMIATGHYASTEYDTVSGRYLLKKARDTSKDQTYMLCGLSQHILSRTLFPLGNMLKSDIRVYAAAHGLPNASAPDSQDICFVPDGDYTRFICDNYGYKCLPGDFRDADGNVLGRHGGMISYTIGQRKGFGTGFGKRMYVISKNAGKNEVILGENDMLYTKKAYATDINLIATDKITTPLRVSVKTRYSQHETPATVFPESENLFTVEFDTPVRAVTPGQALVMYDGDIVVGGGTIITEDRI